MHISYKPLWHTLLERDMRKEDLRLAAGMTTNMIANMSKEGKHISMDTLARICETLNCEITDVIELVPDEPASTGGKEHERIETKNNGKRNWLYPCRRLLHPGLETAEEHRPIGKYGRIHREYLREVHPARLNTLILTGELWTYLADLNEQAQERLDTIMEQMKTAEGVTEELKRTHQMEWVQRCNNIHNRAEEIVLHEMIYS